MPLPFTFHEVIAVHQILPEEPKRRRNKNRPTAFYQFGYACGFANEIRLDDGRRLRLLDPSFAFNPETSNLRGHLQMGRSDQDPPWTVQIAAATPDVRVWSTPMFSPPVDVSCQDASKPNRPMTLAEAKSFLTGVIDGLKSRNGADLRSA